MRAIRSKSNYVTYIYLHIHKYIPVLHPGSEESAVPKLRGNILRMPHAPPRNEGQRLSLAPYRVPVQCAARRPSFPQAEEKALLEGRGAFLLLEIVVSEVTLAWYSSYTTYMLYSI